MTEETRPLADFARSLVLACGVRLRERRRSAPFAVREKGDYRDIVTDHDLWVQEYLLSRLLARWPDHGVLGEEGARRPGSSPWTWVLDPIDGTTNYCQLGKDYAISLGLLREGSRSGAWCWTWPPAVCWRGNPPAKDGSGPAGFTKPCCTWGAKLWRP